MGGGYSGLPSVAFPMESFELYGVSHNVNEYKSKAAESSFICSGVTLLPLGSKWIALARSCMGSDNSCGGLLPGVQELSGEEKMMCDVVHDLLVANVRQGIARSEELIQRLQVLFEGWILKKRVIDEMEK